MSKNYNENILSEGDLQKYQAISKNKQQSIKNRNDNNINGIKTENQYEKALEDSYKKIDSLDKRILALEKEGINNIIQTVSIFIGFFTFVSVEMQIFKNIINWILATSLTLILLGSILIFVTVINWFFNSHKEKNNFGQIIIIIFSLIFIILGVWIIYAKKYFNDDYILKNDLNNYYKKEELINLLNEKDNKINDILKCTKYSNVFRDFKECVK